MTAEQRFAAVVQHLEREVTSILVEMGTPVDPLPRAFAELGWDSLSAVELQYRLQFGFGCELPPEVFEAEDLEELAAGLVQVLDEKDHWPVTLG